MSSYEYLNRSEPFSLTVAQYIGPYVHLSYFFFFCALFRARRFVFMLLYAFCSLEGLFKKIGTPSPSEPLAESRGKSSGITYISLSHYHCSVFDSAEKCVHGGEAGQPAICYDTAQRNKCGWIKRGWYLCKGPMVEDIARS